MAVMSVTVRARRSQNRDSSDLRSGGAEFSMSPAVEYAASEERVAAPQTEAAERRGRAAAASKIGSWGRRGRVGLDLPRPWDIGSGNEEEGAAQAAG